MYICFYSFFSSKKQKITDFVSDLFILQQRDGCKIFDAFHILGIAFGKYKDELVFVDVHIERTEPVLPMVGPGQGLTEMVLAEED